MSTNRLFHTWLMLMALTGASIVAGRTGADAPLGLAGVAVVLLAAGIKCRQILLDFLNLRAADGGWRSGFWSYLALLGLLIFAAYAAAFSGAVPQVR